MEIRKIKADTVTKTVKQLFMDCNYFIDDSITKALKDFREKEKSPVGKNVFSQQIGRAHV